MDCAFEDKIGEVLQCIEKNTANINNFLSVNKESSHKQLNCCKILYDCCRTLEEQKNEDYLTSLFLDDFDLEQVWQQIDLVNKSWPKAFKKSIKDYKYFLKQEKLCTEHTDVEKNKDPDDVYENNDENNDDDDDRWIAEKKMKLNLMKTDDDDEENEDGKELEDKIIGDDESDGGSSSEEGAEKINDDDDDDDNDDNDDITDDGSGDEEKSENEMINGDDNSTRELIRDDGDEKMVKSSFQRRQELLHKKINELEEKAISEKQWQLQGEVTASKRPMNSLMEEVLDFDTASKPATVITDEVNKTIEEKIIQRLKDKIWDGPKRKLKTKERTFNLKKVVLSDEKPQMSLEKIYEQEYLNNMQREEEKLPQEIEELKHSMTSLFRKLDALSNFHFIPKPSVPEVDIVTNNPAITIEDVAPVGISDAMTLAPEEITKKSKKLIGTTERTKSDKKNELKSKKKRQHHNRLERENREKIKKLKNEKKESLHKSLTDIHQKIKEKVKGRSKNREKHKF